MGSDAGRAAAKRPWHRNRAGINESTQHWLCQTQYEKEVLGVEEGCEVACSGSRKSGQLQQLNREHNMSFVNWMHRRGSADVGCDKLLSADVLDRGWARLHDLAVQLWPRVLRMTQVLVSPQFAASVFLDLFVRHYYGILKYNYKHFMSVKVFYWQLHSKSQYLQCWPFFFKTSAIRPGILSINFWATSWLMAAHSCIINAWTLSKFVGFCLPPRVLRIDHKFSMGSWLFLDFLGRPEAFFTGRADMQWKCFFGD